MSQSEGKNAIPTLKEHLPNITSVAYNPHGCVISSTTVGQFTFDFITGKKTRYFSSGKFQLILSKHEKWLFRIECIANDNYAHISPNLKDEIGALNLKKIKSLSPHIFVKGVGHLQPNKNIRNFLIKCLNDISLDNLTRISRYNYTDIADTIITQKKFIDNIAPNLANKIIEISHQQKEFKLLVKELKKTNTNLILKLLLINPVLAFSRPDYFLLSKNEEVKVANRSAFERLNAQLPYLKNTWNTYSNVPYSIAIYYENNLVSLPYQIYTLENLYYYNKSAQRIKLKRFKESINKIKMHRPYDVFIKKIKLATPEQFRQGIHKAYIWRDILENRLKF